MLVLSRRLNESIVLPGLGITVKIVAVNGRSVRLGITAPAGVCIHREEILRRLGTPTPRAGHDDRT